MLSIKAYINAETKRISRLVMGEKPNRYMTMRTRKVLHLDWYRSPAGKINRWIRYR